MPWARALLRGQKVLARVRPDGAFDSAAGRVEVRYKPNDGRAYRAAERNLERIAGEALLPDDACAPAEEAPPKANAQNAQSTQGRSAQRKADAAARALAPGAVPKDAWTVYADGACSGNPGPAGLGVVLVAPDGKIAEGFEYLGVATNNVAELTAILRAAEIIPAKETAVVHTDSQYAIGVLTKGWKAKANQELIAGVKSALAKREGWRLVYVPGHSGVPLNERADELAREAVRTRVSKLPVAPERPI
ncbi:MAG: ribonuclease HI [Labilithrix sp.]|nr:ribonuclease HI [Labilithrix sp.]